MNMQIRVGTRYKRKIFKKKKGNNDNIDNSININSNNNSNEKQYVHVCSDWSLQGSGHRIIGHASAFFFVDRSRAPPAN